jgi:hypothetical protein
VPSPRIFALTEPQVRRTALFLNPWAVCSEPLGLGHHLGGGFLQSPSFGNQLVSRLGQFLDERCVVVRFYRPSCSASAEN